MLQVLTWDIMRLDLFAMQGLLVTMQGLLVAVVAAGSLLAAAFS